VPEARGTRSGLPTVAVVGRPNVGKSSLVNRVLGRRASIVQENPGVTRDRQHFVAEWAGREFELVDTGGLEPGAEGLEERVVEQAQVAIEVADVIVLVVDAIAGPDQDDMVVAQTLRAAGKPVLVAVNKVDDPRDGPLAASFHRLGLGEPLPLSALHGRGSGDFLERLVGRLPEPSHDVPEALASVAIVGRPNVGKSSILNALLREPRSIVDATGGTTRDPVDSYLDHELGRLRIVDTAGIRRQVRIQDPIEYFSLLRARQTLVRVDVVLLVVDAADGVTSHDQRIAREIVERGRGCVVAVNKWDLVPTEGPDRKRFDESLEDKLKFLSWAPRMRTSAVTRRGVDKLVPALGRAVDSHRRRLSTATVNRVVRAAQERRSHPRTAGKSPRVLYAVQAESSPPRFVLFATGRVETSYLRYLERAIRAAEPFEGTPIVVEARHRTRPQPDG
jgi:GTPase